MVSGNFEFKDKEGTVWDCALDLGIVYRIEQSDFSEITKQKIDLLEIDKDMLAYLMSNTKVLMAVIWAVVSPQRDQSIEYEQAELDFIKNLNGKAIQDAKAAFWRAVADFFPEKQMALMTMLNQQSQMLEKINREMTALGPDIEKVMDQALGEEMTNLRAELKELGARSIERPVSSS